MKKIFTLTFALFTLLAISAQENVIRNGDFELIDATETIAGLEDWHMDKVAPGSGWWGGYVYLTSDDSATLYQVVEPITADSVAFELSMDVFGFTNTGKVVVIASTSGADSTDRTLLASDSIPADSESFVFKFGFSENSAYVGKNLIIEITTLPDTGTGAWTNFDNLYMVRRVPGVNNPPVCNPGAYQTAKGTELVTLDGSGSYDPDGDDITFNWISTYPGIQLSDPSAEMPTFTAPDVSELSTFSFALYVNDGTVNSDTLLTNVTVIPAAELIRNGDFSEQVPGADPASINLKDVAYWNLDTHRDSLAGGKWGTFITLASKDPTIYQVMDVVSDKAATYSLTFSGRSSWNCTNIKSIFSVSNADSTVRTEIASNDNLTGIDPGNGVNISEWKTYKQTLSIPANSENVGKKLILELDNIAHDDGTDNGWAEVEFISVVKEVVAGIGKSTIQNLTVYPNPSSGIVYIDSEARVSQLDVYNILGARVRSIAEDGISQVNLEDLNSGLYIIKLTSDSGTITKKVQIK